MQGSRSHSVFTLVRWRWMAAALGWVAACFAIAWWQPPDPYPFAVQKDGWARFVYPIEHNTFARFPYVSANLNGVTFAADGRQGWAVGSGGTLLATTDGGTTWQARSSGTQAWLYSVTSSADGRQGWAVGEGGTLLATTDGGTTWQARSSGTQAGLLSVTSSADGRQGWAVGPGIIILSSDAGNTWRPVRYRRFPAPWFWLSLPFAAGFVAAAFRRRREPVESIGDMGASDAPVAMADADRLDFAPLARGISRFLRNESTEPPITLAIAGDWGTGKSSLMQLLCADLKRNGGKCVWFNAWHHQKEEHLLAALLNAVTTTALPSWLTPSGWEFRLRLLWIRSRKHFAISFALIALIAAATAYLLSHTEDDWAGLRSWISAQSNLLDALGGIVQGKLPDSTKLGPIIAQFVTIIATATALVRGMKAFGADPAVLLSSVAERFRLRDAAAQNSYRMRFAEQFAEVTQALPYRLVIVIDDLDRCRPEAVLEVMEAVNFLTSSGKCFVVFGMATGRVQAALGLAFEKIAHEMVELDSATGESQEKEAAERERRRSYARDYLEKLVNIEIQIPRRDDIAAHRLLLTEQSATSRDFGRRVRTVARLWPVCVVLAAIAVGAAVGVHFVPPQVSDNKVNVAAPPPAPKAGTSPAPTPIQRPDEKKPTPDSTAILIPGDSSSISLGYLPFGVALVLLFALMGAFYRFRSNWLSVKDSDEFEKALEIWAPVVAARRNTPRAIKRFGNRIRYFAMLQQGEALDRPAWRDAVAACRRIFGKRAGPDGGPAETAQPKSTALSESRLIALSALYEAFGAEWSKVLAGLSELTGTSGAVSHSALDRSGKALGVAVRKAFFLHVAEFDHLWPPSDEEIATFKRLLAGVRLPGDAEILKPAAARRAEPESTHPGDLDLGESTKGGMSI